MKRLYVVLAITAFTLVAALGSGFSVFYFLLYALVAALVFSFLWAALNLVGVRVSAQRRAGLVKVGDLVETELVIENRSVVPKFLLEVRDMLELPGQTTGAVVNLRPFETMLWHAQAPLKKRGVFTLGPARAFSSDPFGLFKLHRRYTGISEVTVYPATVSLPYFQLSLADGYHYGARRRRAQEAAPAVSTVREYAHGDSMRRVHWPSTIRTRKWMVKEFEGESGNQLWIVLDMQRDVQAGGEIENTEEYAITIGASIAQKFLEMDWPVGLVAHGDHNYFLAPQRSPATREQILSLLAVAKAEGPEPVADLLRRVQGQFATNASVVIVTASTLMSWNNGLGAVLGKRSHVGVVLIDAGSFGGQDGADQAYQTIQGAGATAYLVRKGGLLSTALDYRTAVNGETPKDG